MNGKLVLIFGYLHQASTNPNFTNSFYMCPDCEYNLVGKQVPYKYHDKGTEIYTAKSVYCDNCGEKLI
jgi:DNA replicative helicase MCM subunit Mcm2 (Cdc46/Mcm family)